MKEIQDKLVDKLVNTGWGTRMRFFLESSDFYDLLLALKTEVEDQKRFTPALKDIFKPLELTYYENTRVVFIREQPFPNPLLNDGLAFSCPEGIKPPYQLNHLLDTCAKEIGYPIGIIGNSLESWSKQGLLLLNASLTCRIMGNNHDKIWLPFLTYLFGELNRKDDLAIVFFGNAKKHDYMLNNETHLKMYVEDLPEYGETWNSEEIFLRINEFLESKNYKKISW